MTLDFFKSLTINPDYAMIIICLANITMVLSIMCSTKGSIQDLIQKYLNRIIPYSHCNHQLHLVIVKAI